MQQRRRSSSKLSIASAGRHSARAELDTMAWLPSLYKAVLVTTPLGHGANTSTAAVEEQENKNGQFDLFAEPDGSHGLGVCDRAVALPSPCVPRLSDVYRSLPIAPPNHTGAQPSPPFDAHASPLLRIRAAAAACRDELA